MKPRLSVLIVSHGHAALVRACLDSLVPALTDISHEIVLVDNLAEPDFLTAIGGPRPGLKCIANDHRQGFGANVNKAARHASGSVFLVLNPDTAYRSGSIREAIDFLEQDERRGIVAARLVNPDGSFQGNFRRFPSLLVTALRGFGASHWRNPPKFYADAMMLDERFDTPAIVDWAYGSFMLMRRDVYEKMNGFDEAFFMYYEDVDLCWRLDRAHYEVWAWPALEFLHDHQRSSAHSLFSASRRSHVTSLLRYVARTRAILRAPVSVRASGELTAPMIEVPREEHVSNAAPWPGLTYVLALLLVMVCLVAWPVTIFLVPAAAASLPTGTITLVFIVALLFFQFILNEMAPETLGDASRRQVGVLESALLATACVMIILLLRSTPNGGMSTLYLGVYALLSSIGAALVTGAFARWVRTPGMRVALVICAPIGSLPGRIPALPVGLHTVSRMIRVDQQQLSAVAEEIGAAIRHRDADAVYVCAPESRGPEVIALVRRLSCYDVPIWYNALDIEKSFEVIRLRSSLRSRTREALKRGLDLAMCVVTLPVLMPVMVVTAVAIWIEDPGPIFFRQPREGRNRVPFGMYKFRSMYAEQCDVRGDNLTTTNDPRITRVGSFIRRMSIDELPQVLNVIKGDMSLVGPRPLPVDFHFKGKRFDDLVADWSLRTRVRPGITGLSQLMGLRGTPDTLDQAIKMMTDRAIYDNLYIDRWSIWTDLKILFRTVFEARFMSGAY